MLVLRGLVALLAAPAWAASPPAQEEGGVCEVAAAAAEQRHALPPGLLGAIGQVESGRLDLATGRRIPYPWTTNASGAGRFWPGRAEAVSGAALLRAGGASLDVGCFQVNLRHHPFAFATLDDAFDPARNADYSARFLSSLRDRLGSWEAAAGAYHSAVPERAGPYRAAVLAWWEGRNGVPALTASPRGSAAAAAIGDPHVIRVAGQALVSLPKVIRPSR